MTLAKPPERGFEKEFLTDDGKIHASKTIVC
jgi:hypothetical protein